MNKPCRISAPRRISEANERGLRAPESAPSSPTAVAGRYKVSMRSRTAARPAPVHPAPVRPVPVRPAPVHRTRCCRGLSLAGGEFVDGTPDPRLLPGIWHYRGFRIDADRSLPSTAHLELPSGAVTLLLGFSGKLTLRPADDSSGPGLTVTSMLSGIRTSSALSRGDGQLAGIKVLMTPWAAFSLFDVPMHELTGTVVDPADLRHLHLDRLISSLGEAQDWATRFDLVNAFFLRLWNKGPSHSPRLLAAWQALTHAPANLPIPELAADTGWSQRQLDRRFREQIGLPPKTAARVLRLRRALPLLAAGRPAAEVALECGYYDQAHLSRECTALTSLSPTRLLAASASHLPQAGDWKGWTFTCAQVAV